ncbi:MAG: ATP-grasp domain-containing protein [Christensenellaceae bacterium]|nr:ATP-grasp domain-containing protein [Christensenellaceae bacterium]
MKTVMLVAGGKWQVPLAKKIKSMGYRLVCSNLYPDSPAFEYADYSEVADVLDIERNFEIAKKYKISAIVSDQSDIATRTIAYIASELKLPTNGVAFANLFSNKVEMRKHCQKTGFPSPKFAACHNVDDALGFYNIEKNKIILKPHDSQSSRGVYIANSPEDVIKYFPLSQEQSHGDMTVIVEDYIEGTEFTVDGIFIDGKHHTLAISKKKHFEFNQNIASELLFSNYDDVFDYDMLRQQNNLLMDSTGAQMGLSHNEYKFMNGKYYLVEMSNRGGGNMIASHIVPLISGVDNYQIYLKQALGQNIGSIEQYKNHPTHKYVMLKFLNDADYRQNKKGIISKIDGLEELKASMGMLEIQVHCNVGEHMGPVTDDSKRMGFYVSFADSLLQIKNIDNNVKNTLKIELEA